MSNTYFLVLCRAVDILCCTVLWRDYDITISSICGLALRKERAGLPASKVLCALGRALNWLQTAHCERAIAADLLRIRLATSILTAQVLP